LNVQVEIRAINAVIHVMFTIQIMMADGVLKIMLGAVSRILVNYNNNYCIQLESNNNDNQTLNLLYFYQIIYI